MDDFVRFLDALAGGRTARRLFRDELPNGIIVSTVNTPDRGPETALLDCSQTIPVERYPDEEEARLGHENWCRIAANLKSGNTVIKLGWSSIDPQEVKIRGIW